MRRLILNTFSIKLFTAICSFVIAIFVSRYLGTSGKGEQSLILVTISFVLLFSNIVGGATLVYLSSRIPLFHLISLSYSWSILISFVSFFLLKYLNIIDSKYVFHISVLSFVFSLSSINSNILLGWKKVFFSNIVNAFPTLITIIALLLFIRLSVERNVYIYIYSLYFSFVFSFILSIVLLLALKRNASTKNNWGILHSFKEMLNLGVYNQLSHLTGLLNARLSFYLIEKYHGTSVLGIYSNGASISEAIWLISGSMALVQYSFVSNSNDITYSQKLSVSLLRMSVFISAVLIVPLLFLPSVFFEFIFGSGFINTNKVILSLAPGVVFYNFTLILGHYFSGNGKYYINTLGSFIGLVITVFFGFWLIPNFGVVGAGITTSLSFFISAIFIAFVFIAESKISYKELFPLWSDIKQYTNELIKIIRHGKIN